MNMKFRWFAWNTTYSIGVNTYFLHGTHVNFWECDLYGSDWWYGT